ncbi:MAG: ribonuclease Z [Desulfurococcales archaeon]|nr:ribonuclease Z [Desulfurococcales archaeon]
MARTVRLVMLGTGGALPTRERLTSCVLVEDWNGNTILLDAGEACQLSLARHGYSTPRIDVIAVTHAHGDHINGLPGILQSMAVNKRRRPLTVVASTLASRFIRDTLEATETGERLGFPVYVKEAERTGQHVVWRRGGDELVLGWFPTCHTRDSVGFTLSWRLRPRIILDAEPPGPSWWADLGERLSPEESARIVYTGDTAPCSTVVENSRGATVLVHEATFASDREEEALERLHSTGAHAALVAREAGAKLLVLTHISARYRGYEARRILLEARRVFPRSVLAYDGMRLSLEVPTREALLSQILASP